MTPSVMPIQNRRMLKLVVLASLVLLLVAVLVSWAWSYYSPFRASATDTRRYELVIERGTIQYWVTVRTGLMLVNGHPQVKELGIRQTTPTGGGNARWMPQVKLSPWKPFSSATVAVGQKGPNIVNETMAYGFSGDTTTIRAVSHWFLAGLLALPVAWMVLNFKGRRAHERAAAGLCIHCGYDLRATPDRCPECGRFADKAYR